MRDIGDDDRLCDIGAAKPVIVDESTAAGACSWLGRASIRWPVVDVGLENCSCGLVSVLSGGEPLFRSTDAVARELRRETGVSGARSSRERGVSEGEERMELRGLVDFCRSATLGRGVIICRILPKRHVSQCSHPRGEMYC